MSSSVGSTLCSPHKSTVKKKKKTPCMETKPEDYCLFLGNAETEDAVMEHRKSIFLPNNNAV